MPLLPGADPQAEHSDEGRARAEKMGTALIKALFGDRFGASPKFVGIKEGLQNFNGFIIGESGERLAFLSFLRFGQGEITTEEHQRKIFESVNQLANGGFPTPRFIDGPKGDVLLTVPEQVEIAGAMVDVPRDLRGSTWAAAQEFNKGTTVPNPVQNLDQARDMGRLLGQYFKVGGEVFNDIGAMQNPVSLRRLQQMVQAGLHLDATKSVAESLAELKTPGSDAETAVAAAIADLRAKIEAEEVVLAGHPKDDELTRREKSLGMVEELARLMETEEWARTTLEAYKEAEDIWQRDGFDQLPDARINGDFHSGNMFAEGIMYDMGWMGDGKRLFDMCQALAISCHQGGKFWPEAAHAFVQGVQEHVELTPQELDALPQMLNITYLRSIATRFTSMVASPETQFVVKSPVELQARRAAYQADILATGKNWAKGEMNTPSVSASGIDDAGHSGPPRRPEVH